MIEGMYMLIGKLGEETLAHGYHCSDCNGEFVFGFNTHDGGSLVLLSDLHSTTKVLAVTITVGKEVTTTE